MSPCWGGPPHNGYSFSQELVGNAYSSHFSPTTRDLPYKLFFPCLGTWIFCVCDNLSYSRCIFLLDSVVACQRVAYMRFSVGILCPRACSKTLSALRLSWQAEKVRAVEMEDYDLAKSLKAEIERVRRECENPTEPSEAYPDVSHMSALQQQNQRGLENLGLSGKVAPSQTQPAPMRSGGGRSSPPISGGRPADPFSGSGFARPPWEATPAAVPREIEGGPTSSAPSRPRSPPVSRPPPADSVSPFGSSLPASGDHDEKPIPTSQKGVLCCARTLKTV